MLLSTGVHSYKSAHVYTFYYMCVHGLIETLAVALSKHLLTKLQDSHTFNSVGDTGIKPQLWIFPN